ncbi:MAG: XisI protein [Moorea sp. SIO1G6]|uniref:XisI protein n=1 Tax=Moorena producens (strain JHB) TaxID=1454205 RepID=A0A1D9G7H5_MOOP1|nr:MULTISPECIES: XisI protein [Moorena]AOY83578.1 XisI protein [Moorena producens JHB]NES85252.1 XisI protein [Moorena sp. SIO2B7]NET63992.1 XisI protein [Moorena sp. SIO1G6]
MDKLGKYKSIVRKITIETGKLGERPDDQVKSQIILDDERGHYLLYFNGWRGSKRTYGCYLHIDVSHDGKVWVHYDGTDLRIAEKLVELSIPKSDIVLGFISPIRRADTGFAID